MNSKNIKLGSYYRHGNSTVGWAKPIEILKPKTGINTTNKILAKCEWTTDKNNSFGMIKYFAISDLKEEKK